VAFKYRTGARDVAPDANAALFEVQLFDPVDELEIFEPH
jgi:hypothetical protein